MTIYIYIYIYTVFEDWRQCTSEGGHIFNWNLTDTLDHIYDLILIKKFMI